MFWKGKKVADSKVADSFAQYFDDKVREITQVSLRPNNKKVMCDKPDCIH